MPTVFELRRQSDAMLFAGRHEAALRGYVSILESQPSNLDARLRVADALLALGQAQQAALIYTGLAKTAAQSGHPLRAITALKMLAGMAPELRLLVDSFARMYGQGSPRLGRGFRPVPCDESRPIRASGDEESEEPFSALMARAEHAASKPAGFPAAPACVPPIPLLSDLPPSALAAMLHAARLLRTRPGDVVVREGDPGDAFYIVARGRVTVHRAGSDDAALLPTAALSEGALFGEMALVTSRPRAATVAAETDCDLVVFERSALAFAGEHGESIAAAMTRFARQRLLGSLLSTSPLFRPLDHQQKLDLIRRFVAHDVPEGTVVITEGLPGQGLFVVLDGDLAVTTQHAGVQTSVATLSSGDVFGEISVLGAGPAVATVTALRASTVLFLARKYFERLIGAVPAIRDYVETLGDARLMETRLLVDCPDTMPELSEDDLLPL